MLAQSFAELSAGVPFLEVKTWGVTARSWRRWNATGRAPRWVMERLSAWRYGVPITAKGWEGFVFREGTLWTPENVPVHAADVRALPYLSALNRELQRKLADPQQWRLL